MPKASTLAKMSDEEYKKLSSLELQQYNNDMPEIDYANPYLYKPFPKMLYKDVDGQVQSATVKNAAELEKLIATRGAGWVESLLELGVETAPAAAEIQVTDFTVAMPTKKAKAAAPAVEPEADPVPPRKAAKRASARA